MPFDLTDCQFLGPALPEPFVRFELENELTKLKLLAKTAGHEGKQLKDLWDVYRRHLAQLAVRGGPVRVRNQVVEPIVVPLGYKDIQQAAQIETREGHEAGGYLLVSEDTSAKLRVWVTAFDEDLDAPAKRGQAYRFSHLRIAQRVLLACGERVGLLTNGVELRLLISDPARPDSQVVMSLDPGWKRSRDVPDSFRLLLALASPAGVKAVPDLVDKARLRQARVTKDLRDQARQAIQRFIQEVLDHPANRQWLAQQTDRDALARTLWHEGLVLVYRLLFVLKLESSDDPARSFSFASTSLWRNTFSPSMALAPFAPQVLQEGAETGGLIEGGMRRLFKMFDKGLVCTELNVKPLGGALFGTAATPALSRLCWGERAVAHLLDQLLWTTPKKKGGARERVHYGPLDVEDLGRVYEALLELEPGISSEPMCRLRRQKLEVVVPIAQGEKYRPEGGRGKADGGNDQSSMTNDQEEIEEEEDTADEDESPKKGKKTTVQWIEEIPADRFYLRVGLGRKASGSYYTPHSFVRFLVQETLGPQVAERSPHDDPQPGEILKLKVLDPAMGSGHFLIEACRFLGQHLYEAARLCDEKAIALERQAEKAGSKEKGTGSERSEVPVPFSAEAALAEAKKCRQRVLDLPDPDDELVRYLPSRSVEGEQSGVSQRRAEALCRRMVAVHCLYGVDKNPLAVELAKLALWLESHAEGMPLTFLDHRLVVGDSLTGPFWDKLITRPSDPKEPIEGVFHQGLMLALQNRLSEAISCVRHLEATVGISMAEVEEKHRMKAELDQALRPFRIIAAAWSGGVMLGPKKCDDLAYGELLALVAKTGEIPECIESERLQAMIIRGLGADWSAGVPPAFLSSGQRPAIQRNAAETQNAGGTPALRRDSLYAILDSGRCVPALPYDLVFPEVFYPAGVPHARKGFDVVLSNPPWEAIQFKSKEFFAAFDFEILNAPTKREREAIEKRLVAAPSCGPLFERYKEDFEEQKRLNDCLYQFQKVFIEGDLAGRQLDAFRVFMERNAQLLGHNGSTGVVVPSAFHANEGATGIRRLYLEKMNLRCCYSFENRRKLFEIDSRFKFALVVATAGAATTEFTCAFYLHDDEWLFGDRNGRETLRYTLGFVQQTGGQYLSIVELKRDLDRGIAETMYASAKRLGALLAERGARLQGPPAVLHMSHESGKFVPTDRALGACSTDPRICSCEIAVERGHFLLFEGKNFWHYQDLWSAPPRYVVPCQRMDDKRELARRAGFYQFALRAIASATNERTAVAAVIPPGALFGHSCFIDSRVSPNVFHLELLTVLDSFSYDWVIRQFVGSNVSLFILEGTPYPPLGQSRAILAHSAIRLTCNHSGYEPLWREQLGDAWREPAKVPPGARASCPQDAAETAALRPTWPVLAGDDERWEVRSAIDAVVADAYGLSRDQYAHVLSTFSHKSYPKAPELCLAKFDELKRLGLDKFTRKYDPYHDIPLNENLPQPVIDLPIPAADGGEGTGVEVEFRLTGSPKRSKRGPGKR